MVPSWTNFWISATIFSVLNITDLLSHWSESLVFVKARDLGASRVRFATGNHASVWAHTLQCTVGYSVTLFPFQSHSLHQSFCVTTSPWIKHAFHLEIVVEEFQIMTHRLKRITIINLDTQNTGTYHQLPEARSYLFETRRLCLSLHWFSGIHFPWEPGPLLCPWPWRLPV